MRHEGSEKLCYITLDLGTELKEVSGSSDNEKIYKPPDGNVITASSERFHCPEVLFKPNFVGKEASGIHDTTVQAIMKTDADIRKDLYSNILLSGGHALWLPFEKWTVLALTSLLSPSNEENWLRKSNFYKKQRKGRGREEGGS